MPENFSTPVHYDNDHRQAQLLMVLMPLAAIVCVALILWVVL